MTDQEYVGREKAARGFRCLFVVSNLLITIAEKRLFVFSETQAKYARNSFRNSEFRVPLTSETRPERERNGTLVLVPNECESQATVPSKADHANSNVGGPLVFCQVLYT
jgi:hypothetical protein